MAIATNTYTRYDAKGLREQLLDRIWDITPMDTPFTAAIGRETATQTLVEWQTDALAAAVTNNQQLEGDDIATYSATTASVRVGNYTQISRKTLIISGTLDAVSKAGRNTEIGYQVPRRGQEIRRDMESHALANVGGNAGNTTTARVAASMGAWIKTNDVFESGASGASPTWTSGVPAAGRTDDGTPVALTETRFKNAVEAAWNSGGTPTLVLANKVNRRKISENFGGIATQTVNIDDSDRRPMASIASIDFYVSDFGTLRIVPDRFQRERDVWIIDTDMASLAVLRNFMVERMAKTGDAEKRMMLIEYTLKVNNEAAHAGVFDNTVT